MGALWGDVAWRVGNWLRASGVGGFAVLAFGLAASEAAAQSDGPRNEIFTGFEASDNYASGYLGGGYAFGKGLYAPGWRLRSVASYGRYRYDGSLANLQKRLDKIERGLHQLRESRNPSGPVYIAEGEPAPEGRDAIVIAMQWIEAEHKDGQSLDGRSLDAVQDNSGLVATMSDGRLLAENSAPRKSPSTLPPSETAAERDKRWLKHLQAVDARGDRYQGDGEAHSLSEIGRYYRRYGVV